MTVLATAGHVDHGKSTFVNFLTGQETDRLKEEKIRGLTINLGYTYFEFKNKKISIVDVPGHVDYFKNTIAGFANVDGIIFCIDCKAIHANSVIYIHANQELIRYLAWYICVLVAV